MFYKKKFTKIIAFLAFLLILFSFNVVKAQTSTHITFNVSEGFDLNGRSQIDAVLVKTKQNIYFYIEEDWWSSQSFQSQNDTLSSLDNLSDEFNTNIYPVLTSIFGSEWKPGVDGDNKIAVFFHSMKPGIGGYFNSADEYLKLQIPKSNEREMVYISTEHLNSFNRLKILLSHEFTHLIEFNQKERISGSQEEVWLNEAIADYAVTVLGYDDKYFGSNLEKRVKDFLEKPTDSLTEWQETKYDYAINSAFFHYLVDHYGINILSDSLESKLAGIESINEALLKNGYEEDFGEIYTNWTIATVLNNCSLDIKYCYLNKNLTNLRISPTLNFLPLSGNSSLSVTNVIKNWSANWQKIIGGNGDLKLEFESSPGLIFSIPYIIIDDNNGHAVNFLVLDQNGRGSIDLKNFGAQYSSITIIPSLQTKTSGFNGFEFTYPYTIKATISGIVSEEEKVTIQKLLEQIDLLKKQLADLQLKINSQGSSSGSCTISSNLYFGIKNSQVNCLQQFLVKEGGNIYPEGLITGYFGSLTRSAVIRFQEKYKSEILLPFGLSSGTGFVGSSTRQKINQLILNGQ